MKLLRVPISLLVALTAIVGQVPLRAISAEATAITVTDTTNVASGKQELLPNWCYYVSGDRLVKVEETPLDVRASVGAGDLAAHMLWGGGGKTWMTLVGSSSELQVTESQPTFRMSTERSVALAIRLASFEVRKDNRWAQTERQRALEFFKKPISLQVKKIGDGLYELTPSAPLKPGEYGLAISAAGPVADFTIVGESKSDKQ